MEQKRCFAEVVTSSLQELTAQTWQWDICASFGSLVTIKSDSLTLFGLVYHIETGSIDPNRTPFIYQKTITELKKEQPHIFELLKTVCRCIIIGFSQHDAITYHTPPKPPYIHSFVCYATETEYRSFFAFPTFMHRLFSCQLISNTDELILAIITHLVSQSLLDESEFDRLIDVYSHLIHHDYARLRSFLQRTSI